uniref:Uncharacterized protein n=1 Tax=Angiostrongylus cantonensis TaxID=6313 RepID=A0A0K0D0U3_ANGCA
MVRKGGRLERLYKRTLNDYCHTRHQSRHHHYRHKRRCREQNVHTRMGEILAQMDSVVRPRFGRSAGFFRNMCTHI